MENHPPVTVEIELNRARELEKESELHLVAGRWTGVVTSSYGAMFHLARALIYHGRFEKAEETRELRNLERLPEEAATVAFDEATARLSREQLLAFRAAVESKLSRG